MSPVPCAGTGREEQQCSAERGHGIPCTAMRIPSWRRLIVAILLLSGIAFIPTLPPFVRMVCGAVQAFFLPGFVFFILFWDRRSPALDAVFIPAVISPILLSLFVAFGFVFVRSLGSAVAIAVLVLWGLLLVALVRRNALPTSEASDDMPRAVVLISLLLCGMVAVFYVLNPYLLARSDAFVHAPIVSEIIDRGIPPAEPRLPSDPIRYPWFYHLFAASVVRLTGLSVFGALGLCSVISAFVFPYLIVRITSHFTRKRIHLLSTPIFAIAGLGSAYWILWPIGLLRALAGEVRGHQEIARILSETDLNSVRVIYFLTPHWLHVTNMVDKLLVITPFTCAINLFLMTFLLVLSREFQRKFPLRTAFMIAFSMLGAFLIHVVTGIVLLLAAVGGGLLMLALQLVRKRNSVPRYQTVVIPALALLAGVIGLPYFRSLTGGAHSWGEYLHVGFRSLVTILAPFVGLAFIVRPLARFLFHEAGLERKVLVSWLVALLIVSLSIKLPGENQVKFITLLFTLLIIPASIVLTDWIASSRGARRIGGMIWITILMFVPPVLTARGIFLERPETAEIRMACTPGSGRMQLYDWIRNETPNDCVIIERNTFSYSPLFAHRHTLLPLPTGQEVLGYSDQKMERSYAVQREIFSPEPVPEASIEFLRNLRQAVYLLIWAEDLHMYPYLSEKIRSLEPTFKKVFETPSGVILQLTGQSRGGEGPVSPLEHAQPMSSCMV
jgi:hypothetical protein